VTTATETSPHSASPDSSWADELPPIEVVELPPDDATDVVNPPAGTCPTCGDPVYKEPGKKGRVPKYHPECRPSAKRAGTGTVSPARVVRVSKAEQIAAEQTEQILEGIRSFLFKSAGMLALVDPFDALVIWVNAPNIITNLRPILQRSERLRVYMLTADTGGSVLGLIFAVASILLPILAHHNLIGSKRATQFLIQLPMLVMRLHERMAEGNEETMAQELLVRVGEQWRKKEEAKQRAASGVQQPSEFVGASAG